MSRTYIFILDLHEDVQAQGAIDSALRYPFRREETRLCRVWKG